ncbi:DUF3761 domain-containing protein [Streptomyces sp. NPDC058202]|uniref:DUF3761 domain-containing protein n=1 Tax=Streptomyces sp. NPDC058202 TaxID=3346380 RepID=UPI0036E4617E
MSLCATFTARDTRAATRSRAGVRGRRHPSRPPESHRPSSLSAHPRGATAKCKDNTYSYSAHFRGTCSHHRGVKYWYR